MHKSIALLLNFLVALALATSGGAPARAQGSSPAITEAEAHAIAVDAYVYFYSLITIDVTRRQATNVEPGKVMLFGPANMFASAPAFPAARRRFGAGHRWQLLPAADARHVDGCFCIPRLAHHWNAGGQLSGHAAGLERDCPRGNDAHQRADALCLDHRPHQDGRSAGL